MMLKVGSFLQDRYEILEQIGSGGMSEVYRAKCHKLNRLVAIKLLKEEFSQDSNFVSKFKMEAQSAAGLSHPNIVSVFDVVDEEDLHYIVMEVIEGITLKSYILKKGHLGVKESIGIAIQVAQGIGAAHDQHIVHRDIKPQNMIISRDGKVKVADFGIARAVSSQTVGSTAVGSVHYISPEQARGGYSDARSDIYSLGITMYEMVTGKVPFDGENTVTIALSHLEQQLVPPRVINLEVTPSLERIILKCTQKKPELRYKDAYELIADLRRALVDPEDNFMKQGVEEDNSSPTVIIGGSELNAIKEGTKKEDRVTGKILLEETKEAEKKAGRNKHGKKKQGKNLPDDVNPQIEKILTTVGIVAACIIIVVVVSIFAQVGGGMLNFGSGKTDKTTEAVTEEQKETEEPETTAGDGETEESSLAGQVDLTTLGLEKMTAADAKALLEQQGFVVTLQTEGSETVVKDMVTRFEPAQLDVGGAVTLFASTGPTAPTLKVPDITNMTPLQAKAVLEAVSMTLGVESQEKSESVAKGSIIRQSVIAGSDAVVGTIVNYTVSSGKGTVYAAVVNDEFPLKDLFGPSTGDAKIRVMIEMRQNVNGQEVTKTILEPRVMTGDITIPVHYKIIGAEGVLSGELRILDLTNDKVLKTYALEFLEVDE